MDDAETKLDVILEGIRQSEDHILEIKRRIREVQERMDRDRKEAEKLKGESIQLESETAAARQQVASLEAELLINEQLKSNIEEQASATEVQVEEKRKSLELMEKAGKEVRERLLAAVKNFYSQVRLDNPDILARREAIKQEQQHLSLEKMRLLCEIKVLEDNNRELESLQAEKHKYEMNIYELKRDRAHWEADLNKRFLAAQLERDRLLDLKCPYIERLTQELKCIQEEGEYLKSALLAMKRENQKLCQELRMQGSAQVSRPSVIVEPWFRSRHQPLNIVSPRQRLSDSGSFPDNVPSTHNSTETVLQDVSWSTVGNISTDSSQNFAWSQADKDDNVKSCDNTFTRSAGTSSNNLQESVGPQTGNISSVQSGGTVVTSTYQAGVTPSTPRTFTRNPPPPTPQSEVESRSVLPLHLLGHFTCVSARGEESEGTSDGEDSRATQALASVKDLSTSTCKANNAQFRQPVTTTTCSTSIQKPKPAGHLGEDTSDKYSPCNSGGSSMVLPPLGESSRDHSCEVVLDVPAKTSVESAHNFAPGWASISSVDMDQDVPEEMSMSHPSKEDNTLGRNTQYNESMSAYTFAPGWASVSASDVEENSPRKVSDCMYKSDITHRNEIQDVQDNSAYAKNFSSSVYAKNSSKSQSFINDSTQGNNFQNDQSKLHFKFRRTTVHMQTSVEESSTDSFRQNFNSYSNQKTRGNCTPSWSFRKPGTSHQPYSFYRKSNHGCYKTRTSWKFPPQGKGYMVQRAHDNHVTRNRNLTVSDVDGSNQEGRKIRFSNRDEVCEIPLGESGS